MAFGITNTKKKELDALATEVINVQHEIVQIETLVSSLTQKLVNFKGISTKPDGKPNASYRRITRQLSNATISLNKTQVKLKSLQMGLAAANAAALAS